MGISGNVYYLQLICLIGLFSGIWARVREEDPTSFVLHCYSGEAVVLGDAKDDGIECHPFLGFRQYCYKFVAESSTNTITELGCASVLCAGVRETCADMEFAGYHGTLCCCNDRNYCNDASMNKMMSEFLSKKGTKNLCIRNSIASSILIFILQRFIFYFAT